MKSATPSSPLADVEHLSRVLDPFGIGASLNHVMRGWLAHPEALAEPLAQFTRDLALLHASGGKPSGDAAATRDALTAEGDRRFDDPEWSEGPYALLRQYYLLYTHCLMDALFDTPGVPGPDKRRAAFWVRQWLNAVAPTNFLPTNPVALRKLRESGGNSLLAGMKLLLDDMRAGDVRMTDTAAFTVGRDLAVTPGAVVYRNELMELIQYAPATPTVCLQPVVFVPPWINKYYILDLTPDKSLLRYLVGKGLTVFVISWKNPTARQASVTFENYLMQGVRQALDVARAICRTPRVHAAGYCIGGTALATLMAWLNAEHADAKEVPVAHWSLLTTLLDFSRPGAIEAFINEETVDTLEEIMAHQGYLEGRDMARSFRMLRPNSLIWHYFVHSYLYGEAPGASDVLFWNTDTTRMPRAMHSFYLREFYLKNRLIQKDGLTLAGHGIDLARIRQPLYAIGCEEDHIAPWKATFSTAGRIGAPVRYTLSSSGHILGIINPPSKTSRRGYWSGRAQHERAEDWLKRQHRVDGSWWEDWAKWLVKSCGRKVRARQPGSATYPALDRAPGLYVHEI